MTHHFNRVSLSPVSERDLLIRHGLNMYVMGEESHEYKITWCRWAKHIWMYMHEMDGPMSHLDI
jgi:hypothetical protein